MTALLILALLQDDVAGWVDKLANDDIATREEATRRLASMDPAAIETLEKIKTDDLEQRGRLDEVLAILRARRKLAGVFGPTKRATISARGRKLGDVLAELGRALDEKLEGDGFAADATIDLELKESTLWESLDALAAAAKAHYEYEKDRVVLRPGRRPSFPVLYAEQFRVSPVELKRLDYIGPGKRESAGVIVLEARYQRNMKPGQEVFHNAVVVKSVVDASGDSAAADGVEWGGITLLKGRPFAAQKTIFVNPEAPGPLRIEGTTDILFVLDEKEITVPLDGEARETKEGDITFIVQDLTSSPAGISLTLASKENVRDEDAANRMVGHALTLFDAAGKGHAGRWHRGSIGRVGMLFTFPPGIEKPQKLVFRWVTKFHRVEIPFTFEGIQIP